MSELTEIGPFIASLSQGAQGNPAPTLDELMGELKIKRRPGFLRKFPSGVQTFLTNGKGVAGLIILTVFVVMAALAPLLSPFDPYRRAGKPHVQPGVEHFLGTSRQGKDIFSQLLEGGRTSLTVGFIAGISATLIGLGVGISAGYFGGKVDEVLTFFVNVALVLPALPLIIVLASFVEEASPTIIGLVLAFTGWGWSARTIRTQTLSIKSREFVLAAELMGEKKWRIIVREILPNMSSFVVGGAVLATIYGILAEAALEFIGLGSPSSVTWGTMLYWAQRSQSLQTGAWWEVWPPAVAIMVTGAALVLINFGVDEITSPQLRAARLSGRIKKFLKRRGRSVDVF
ncbi:MAG: peptide transporter permease [Devosia sp.]|uniref:ABC transporter permease n=1 Tax=Devosia sp. TaxID=1871048 RepID=UPI00262525BD|nr:ABC transporter permease [Devosia sp.]MDB5588399.1 peptide transporter permease [Devosia sp.]